jgi:hypothetical protein
MPSERTTSVPYTDIAGLGVLLVLTAIVAWARLAGGWSLLGTDSVIFFIPMWGFLGRELRMGDIPGWNPHQFAGTPFAGDPESGWMYLPVMFFFTILSPVFAFKTLVVFHLHLAGLSTYALGRALRLGVLASLAAGIAYEFGAFLEFTRCCTAYAQVAAWLPLVLLGVELAIRARTWLPRIIWWAVAGFAISQIVAAWLGQGAYNALLVVGGFVAYRTLLAPPETIRGPRARLGGLVLHGTAILLIGFGLAAAAFLPRLDANSQSTLAGGVYGGDAARYADRGGWALAQAIDYVLSIAATEQRYYVGGATLALALLAPLLARRRFAVPFFALASLAALTLTLNTTPLHRVFYLLPRFQTIHEHYPPRVLVVFYLGPALLAGATVAALPRWTRKSWLLAVAGALLLLALLAAKPSLQRGRAAIATSTVVAAAIVALLLTVYAFAPGDRLRPLISGLIVAMIFVDPTGWLLVSDRVSQERASLQAQAVLAAYGGTDGAGAFLRARQAEQPARYFGYDPASMGPGKTYHPTYDRPLVPALLVNNRATYVGLDDLSGYNPIQSTRYRDLVEAINGGEPQDYHQTNLLPSGLVSPLLNLLNARYIVIPAVIPPNRSDLLSLTKRHPTVYQDKRVRVLENRDAFPRAWLVHDAVQVPPAEALGLMTSGTIDLRTVAVLETHPPPLAHPDATDTEQVRVTSYEPDRMRLTVSSEAAGLLMVSEVYDPNWHAYVDGNRTPVLVADHALRTVPVPAGVHTVELRFEPRSLRIGLAVSLVTVASLAGLIVCLAGYRYRDRRRKNHVTQRSGGRE